MQRHVHANQTSVASRLRCAEKYSYAVPIRERMCMQASHTTDTLSFHDRGG